MRLTGRFAALALAVLLAACSQNQPEEASPDAGAGAGGAGSPLDPATVEYFQQAIGDRVFFATDSSILDASAQATLRGQAGWLIANPGRSAVIEGHADERGTRDYNLALGARRASAVRNFLVAEGVPADRLRSVTFGKERPESLCANESCWSRNRRGVTVMATGPTS
ncbi:MAG: OmpA family protein [Pseudomonadota bacterium]